MLYAFYRERRYTLDQDFYHTGQFARKAQVSVRTLRYYDKVGLLSPSLYTESGHRLYTDKDLLDLQQILALKFLGFSLEQIKIYLQTEPQRLQTLLAAQKAMMKEKRTQLDTIIQAIDEAEQLLQTDQCDWNTIVRVIQAIQMEQNQEWANKYFTPEQRAKMQEISQKSYTEEDAHKIAQWGQNWSEEDQKAIEQQWSAVFADLKHLVTTGSDPASPASQTLANQYSNLIGQFTHGDPGVETGLKNWWQNFNELPASEKPMPSPFSKEEGEFLQKAMTIYQQNQN